ncbi:MAG: histidine phosphatase family protein [Pseudomonadota bacterium]
MRLFLVRHGQIQANKDGLWHGSTDSPLTWKGRRQAKRTGRWFKRHTTFQGAYTSPLERCRNTAKFILSGQHSPPELVVAPNLAEMSIGDWEGLPFKVLHEDYGLFAKIEKDPGFVTPNGESLTSVGARVAAALQNIMQQHEPGQNILITSHGVAMSAGLSVLFDEAVTSWRDYRLANCSITEIQFEQRPLLVAVNQTFHL